jgi:hypothetical protein
VGLAKAPHSVHDAVRVHVHVFVAVFDVDAMPRVRDTMMAARAHDRGVAIVG